MADTNMRMAIIGQNLKKSIKESPFKTQEAFAAALNCDPSTVRRYIKHGVNSVATLLYMAELLQIAPEKLL